MNITREHDYVFQTIKSRDVHFVRFWFTDIFGILKQFAVIPNDLDIAFSEGMGFDGSAIRGFGSGDTQDLVARPEAQTFQLLPWRPSENSVARMFCSVLTSEGVPFEGDSRYILRREVQRAAERGYVMNVGPELEFYYFKNDSSPDVLDNGSYFDCGSLDAATDLRRNTVLTLEKMGIPVAYSHHEGGPSQHEIDLRHDEPLTMADNIITYRMATKAIASQEGVYASFMPQPLPNVSGNGFHVNQSLCDFEGNNLFYDSSDPLGYDLSDLAKKYIAGILKYAPEFALITNSTVNSYRRLADAYRAPRHVGWAHSSRTSMIRIPRYKPQKKSSARIDVRNADGAANPYLCFALMLAAGLRGIDENLELPNPLEEENLRPLSHIELERRGITSLPENLGEAIDLFEASDFMREFFGEQTHHYIVKEKRREWISYMQSVSQWEIDNYLSIL